MNKDEEDKAIKVLPVALLGQSVSDVAERPLRRCRCSPRSHSRTISCAACFMALVSVGIRVFSRCAQLIARCRSADVPSSVRMAFPSHWLCGANTTWYLVSRTGGARQSRLAAANVRDLVIIEIRLDLDKDNDMSIQAGALCASWHIQDSEFAHTDGNSPPRSCHQKLELTGIPGGVAGWSAQMNFSVISCSPSFRPRHWTG